jgi:hypothetical protein
MMAIWIVLIFAVITLVIGLADRFAYGSWAWEGASDEPLA